MWVGKKEPCGYPENDDSRSPPGKVKQLRARPDVHQFPPLLGITPCPQSPGLKSVAFLLERRYFNPGRAGKLRTWPWWGGISWGTHPRKT